MPKYELTFLLNEESELKNLENLIASLTGKLIKEQSLGKKELSYPIKKISSANFYNWVVEIDSSQVKELRKKLDFNEKLIRYLLLVTN